MNAPKDLQQLTPQTAAPFLPDTDGDDEINLSEYWDIVVDNRWLVGAITAITLALGTAYVLFSSPVYEANLLIQVEDSSTSAKSFLGEAASLFDVKTPATAEIELLRSRMIIGQAVDSTHFYIDARPRYIPIVGKWLARRAEGLSKPGILGIGGWVSGTERISVASMDVPPAFENERFRVTALPGGKFTIDHDDLAAPAVGEVGRPIDVPTPYGNIRLLVTSINAESGAQFNLTRYADLDAIEGLQEEIKLSEKGRQSGVIDVRLQDTDPFRLITILNEIGSQYVRQNVQRKAAEAQKTLAFLDTQLPQFKKQLDQSEEAYNRYRNRQGTVAMDEEAKLMLARSIEIQGKLAEARQKRLELLSRFRPEHPVVATLDSQIAAWSADLASMNSQIRTLPSVQQDAIRLERDVKVNNELYQQLRNNALQLQLVREGKIGNVRVIDSARVPKQPVKPKKGLTLSLAFVMGLIGGISVALLRSALNRGIRNPQEIEERTGLNVYSTIPFSDGQRQLAARVANKEAGLHVLAHASPDEPAIESLRSLRTAVQFAMLDAPNNRLLITGATPSVGKSFISANLAAVLTSAGARVLLIDADLRKGYLNRYFGLGRGRGLSDVLTGAAAFDDAVHKDVIPNLDLLTTGAMPPNPAELLIRGRLRQMLDQVSSRYDTVIIDTAPVLAAADTLSLAPHVGSLLLVARAGETQVGELRESARRLGHAGTRITGVLFNALDMSHRYYGRYSYRYGSYKYREYSYAPLKKSV